jgi:hypothetical protein
MFRCESVRFIVCERSLTMSWDDAQSPEGIQDDRHVDSFLQDGTDQWRHIATRGGKHGGHRKPHTGDDALHGNGA